MQYKKHSFQINFPDALVKKKKIKGIIRLPINFIRTYVITSIILMYQQTTYFIDNTNIASFLHVETQSQSPVVFLKHVGSRTSINIHPFTISRPWIIVPVFSSLSFQLNTPIFSARKPVSYRRVLRYVRDVPRHVSNRTTFPSRYVHALCTLFPSIFPDFPLLSLSLSFSPLRPILLRSSENPIRDLEGGAEWRRINRTNYYFEVIG